MFTVRHKETKILIDVYSVQYNNREEGILFLIYKSGNQDYQIPGEWLWVPGDEYEPYHPYMTYGALSPMLGRPTITACIKNNAEDNVRPFKRETSQDFLTSKGVDVTAAPCNSVTAKLGSIARVSVPGAALPIDEITKALTKQSRLLSEENKK